MADPLTSVTIKADSWPDKLAATPGTIRAALYALKKESVEVIVERGEGLGLRVMRFGKRYHLTRMTFSPLDHIVTHASDAVAPTFHGPAKIGFLRAVFGVPKERLFSQDDTEIFMAAFVAGTTTNVPHKWISRS